MPPAALRCVLDAEQCLPRSSLCKFRFERDQREASARGIAALTAVFSSRPHQGLLFILDRENTIADGKPIPDGQIHQTARGFIGHDLEMIGFAANDAA